jgi:hypothetical protein
MSIISRMNNSVRVTYLYLVIALGTLAVFVSVTMDTFSFQSQALRANGIVVEIITKTSSTNSDVTFNPKIEYLDKDYDKYVFVSNWGSNPSSYKLNDAVEVLYIHQQQGTERISSLVSLWAMSLLMFIVGGCFVVYSFINFKRLKNSQIKV